MKAAQKRRSGSATKEGDEIQVVAKLENKHCFIAGHHIKRVLF